MISVVIPLYNKAATIERAIRSVLNQTIQDFELIVVNNGSTDGGGKKVEKIEDSRLRLVEQENQGVSMARNRGIDESHCDWIAFLDADDEWKPTFLETVLSLQSKYPECQVCATAYQRQNANGELQNIRLNDISNNDDFIFDNYFQVASKSDPPFCSISVMVKKAALLSIGGFPNGVHQGEDLLTWARLAASYKIAYCQTPQSIFYTGETSAMDLPKRVPAKNDIVGYELEKIYNQNSLPYLDQYISKWHKMRASIYLRLPNSSSHCRKEISIAKHWHYNSKLNFYLLLSYIPYSFRMKILALNH